MSPGVRPEPFDIEGKWRGLGSIIEPGVDEVEYARRISRVREALVDQKLDMIVVQSTPNVSYLTGYEPPRGNAYVSLVLPVEGDAFLHIIEEDAGLIPDHPWLSSLKTVRDEQLDVRFELLAELIRALRPRPRRIGIESSRYPVVALAEEVLSVRLTDASLVDSSQMIVDIRHVKSEAELAHMRQAAIYSGIGMQAAIAKLRVGYTDNDIGAAAYASMLEAGSEVPYPAPFIMVGERTGWGPHLSWKRFPIRAGDIINIELTGIHRRYAAPIYRTAVIGEPSELVRDVARAVLDCVNVVLTTARPGESAHDVAVRATKELDPIRDRVYCTGQVSYGVGLTLSPNWVEHSFRIIEGNHRPLVPGMTFHAPTAVRLPGQFAVCFSETWVMTESGPEVLTKEPRELVMGTA